MRSAATTRRFVIVRCFGSFWLLDSILDATEAAQVTRENHDLDTITPAAPDFDPSEYAPTKQAAIARASLDVSTGRVALMCARLLPWHGLAEQLCQEPGAVFLWQGEQFGGERVEVG